MTKSFSSFKEHVDATVSQTGICRCVFQPEGRYGLEGYQLGETYRFSLMNDEKLYGYYRVYPGGSFPDYYETCSRLAFGMCFEVVEETA